MKVWFARCKNCKATIRVTQEGGPWRHGRNGPVECPQRPVATPDGSDLVVGEE